MTTQRGDVGLGDVIHIALKHMKMVGVMKHHVIHLVRWGAICLSVKAKAKSIPCHAAAGT
jgi:hypothetical protein